jgi:phage tail-like protein
MILDQMIHTLTIPGFRFVVAVDGNPLGVFTELTLPTIEWEIEEIKEGGLNSYIHQLPGRRRSSKVVLKNGVAVSPDLRAWYIRAMYENFARKNVTITLLNALFVPMMVINIQNAIPIKWTGPQLQSDQNTVAVQTLELGCGEITLV